MVSLPSSIPPIAFSNVTFKQPKRRSNSDQSPRTCPMTDILSLITLHPNHLISFPKPSNPRSEGRFNTVEAWVAPRTLLSELVLYLAVHGECKLKRPGVNVCVSVIYFGTQVNGPVCRGSVGCLWLGRSFWCVGGGSSLAVLGGWRFGVQEPFS